MAVMKNEKITKRSILKPAVDRIMGFVRWTKNRTVIIHRRSHAGREYIRLHTFNRHKTKNCWYPGKRFYMIPLASAERLGRAIIAAARDQSGPMPEWYPTFEKQYHEWQKKHDSSKAPKE